MLDPTWFTGDDFVMVHPDAVRSLDGDVLAVYVLARLRFRTRMFGYERDGRQWWRVSTQLLADDLGISPDRVRRTLRTLTERGLIDAVKHREGGTYDQTLSYALNYRTTDVADSPNRVGGTAECHVADSPNVHVADSPNVPYKKTKNYKEHPPPAGREVESEFKEFWDAYPRKVGPVAARREFDRVTRDGTPSSIITAAARAYAASDLPEARYIPHPATWLKDGRWGDQPPTRGVDRPRERCAVYGHEYFPAHNCPGCRSEELAVEGSRAVQ